MHTSIVWSNVGDGESLGVGVVILGEGGVVLEEVGSWNGISIDLTHQLDTPPQPSNTLEQSYQEQQLVLDGEEVIELPANSLKQHYVIIPKYRF